MISDRYLFSFFRGPEVKAWSKTGSGQPRPYFRSRVAEVQRALSVGIAAGPRKGWSLSRQGEAGNEASVPVLCGPGLRMGMGRPLCSAMLRSELGRQL